MDLLVDTENGVLQAALHKLTAGVSREVVNDWSSTTLNDVRRAIAIIQEDDPREPRYNLERLLALLVKVEQYGQTLERFMDSSRILSFIWVGVTA
jgi:hypothetical protein